MRLKKGRELVMFDQPTQLTSTESQTHPNLIDYESIVTDGISKDKGCVKETYKVHTNRTH